MHRLQPEFNLLAGECKMKLGLFKDAAQYFSNMVRVRPKSMAGWEALIRCLFNAESFEDALEQTNTCLLYTSPSPRDRTRYRMPSSA